MQNLRTFASRVLASLSAVEWTLLTVGFAVVLFFSSYKLFASPETWMDEGLIIQSAQGLLETGKAAIPVAPGVYEPMGYITTGFPVTLPLASVFALFGTSLEAARLVMLVFLLLFYVALWVYARKAIGGVSAWFGFFLLIFFAPIYGNGRNVLGEVPGLLCVLLALFPLVPGGVLSARRALCVGFFAGLAIATKPIFILFVFALFLTLLLRQHELRVWRVFGYGVLGFSVSIAIWVWFQFDHMSVARLLVVYTNPHDVNVLSAIQSNLKRFVTESQPIFFLAALMLWMASYVLRKIRHEAVPVAEEVLLFFSLLVLCAYIRTVGYYRYFFLGQVFATLYIPSSLWHLVKLQQQFTARAVIVGLCLLTAFQAYTTTFNSWVAKHYTSSRTATLRDYFKTLPKDEEVFVYQAPELIPFVGIRPTYQYVEITPSIRGGEAYKMLVQKGKAPHVITSNDAFTQNENTVFSQYVVSKKINDYMVLEKKI